MLPALFAELDVHSSGLSHARAGSFVDRPSARALYSTPERIFHATSTFAGLKGPLERGPCSLKFYMRILCFVFRSLSLVSTLRHVLSIVYELMSYDQCL